MSLYRKYRPKTLDEVVGNEEALETLHADVTKKDPPAALAFYGSTGTGKTSLSRIAARMLGAIGSDFIEINAADFRGIDTARDIRRQANYAPMNGGGCRVWLLDECHQGSKDFLHALLKLLEEPPSHARFILATTDPDKLLPTIRSRCAEYFLKPLLYDDMKKLLKRVVKAENESLKTSVYETIIDSSQGLPRTALQILDQVLAVVPDKRNRVAERAAEKLSTVIELCRTLLQPNPSWRRVAMVLQSVQAKGDEDPERVRRAILAYASSVLLKGESDRAAVIIEAFEENVFDSGWAGVIFACYRSVVV